MMKVLFFLMIIGSSVLAQAEIEDVSVVKLMFALQINDPQGYQLYREGIAPVMEELGVTVLEEYEVSRVIKTQSNEKTLNRVAIFQFPSEAIKTQFFSNTQYLAVKSLFEASTSNYRKLIE